MSRELAKDFKKIREFITVFKSRVVHVAKDQTRLAAERLRDEVRETIEQQKYKLAPLSPAYVKAKQRGGLDPRTLIATAEYLDAIDVVETEDGWKVGLPDKVHQGSGLQLNVIARIHEFGSRRRHIPARPVWRPVWAEFLRKSGKVQGRNIFLRLKKGRRGASR